jgi:Ca-activated chloride channel homolog
MDNAWAKSSPSIPGSNPLVIFVGDRARIVLYSFFAMVLVVVASSYGTAQVNMGDAHVLSRTMSTAAQTERVLRKNVDLVLVNVTVLDGTGRAVTGLELTNFSLLDEKHPQVIRYLSKVDEPLSLMVVLDTSASMTTKIQELREAFDELVNTSNPQDDFGLIVVGDEPRVALHFNDSAGDVVAKVDALQPEGATALWDALDLGMRELKNSGHQRKAMVVISDGGDNHSRLTEAKLKSLLKEADAEVYAIGVFNPYANRIEEKKGPLQLAEVTSVTGGRVLSADDSVALSHAVAQISNELRNQYVLGYYPNNPCRDGKWRRLKVRLATSPLQESFRLYAKKGYYAPSE